MTWKMIVLMINAIYSRYWGMNEIGKSVFGMIDGTKAKFIIIL